MVALAVGVEFLADPGRASAKRLRDRVPNAQESHVASIDALGALAASSQEGSGGPVSVLGDGLRVPLGIIEQLTDDVGQPSPSILRKPSTDLGPAEPHVYGIAKTIRNLLSALRFDIPVFRNRRVGGPATLEWESPDVVKVGQPIEPHAESGA